MPVTLTSLDALDDASVDTRLERLTAIVEDLGAGIEVRRGAFHDLVLAMYAAIGQAYSDATDKVIYSTTPVLSLQNSGAIDSALLTAAADAQGVTRKNGTTARGSITIVVSQNRSVLVPRGTIFTTDDGRRVVSLQAFAARTTGSVVESLTDRVLVQRADGNYEFTIEAVADTEGLSGNIQKDVLFRSVSVPVPYYVTSYVQSAFSGGSNTETDSQLLSRLLQAIPATSLSTRASVPAVINRIPGISPSILNVSTIGYGDCELQRGRNMIARVAKADTYARTAVLPSVIEVEVQATAVEVRNGETATWQFPLGRDDAPGHYLVSGITDGLGTTYSDITMERGFDASPIQDQLVPEILEPHQAAFSRFATATVRCYSPAGTISVGDTRTLRAQVRAMPFIADLQGFLGSREYRFVGGDLLVRAPIPVFVSVGIQIHQRPGVVLSDPQNIRTAVANEFNLAGFATKIHGSRISTIVNNLLPAGADVNRLDFITQTILPSGEICRERTTDSVEVKENCLLSVTGRTAVFICDPANITVTAYEETTPRVV